MFCFWKLWIDLLCQYPYDCWVISAEIFLFLWYGQYQCWFDVVYVAYETFVGFVGVVVLNGPWTFDYWTHLVLNLSGCS